VQKGSKKNIIKKIPTGAISYQVPRGAAKENSGVAFSARALHTKKICRKGEKTTPGGINDILALRTEKQARDERENI